MADFDRMLVETEDFLMRQLGSRAARERSRRRMQRGVGEALRRVRRAMLLFLLLVGALIVFSVAFGSVGFFTWLVALPTAFLAASLSLAWPTRAGRRRHIGSEPLAPAPLGELAGNCEEWLVDQADSLPRASWNAVDEIVARLRAMQPHLGRLDEADTRAGEARRLIGDHLPKLVDAYVALPFEARAPASESSRRFADSLDIVAAELSGLCERLEGCRIDEFETRRRFIETRYGGAGRLEGP